ncbi:MAG: hypothetical protein ACYDCL_21550 [Myxococcales bacterium]
MRTSSLLLTFAAAFLFACNGPTGPSGTEGPTGPTGPTGPAAGTGSGVAGPTGPQGPQGPQGTPGPQGLPGPTGPVGAIGPTGPTGANGAAGTQGGIGPTGPTGLLDQAGLNDVYWTIYHAAASAACGAAYGASLGTIAIPGESGSACSATCTAFGGSYSNCGGGAQVGSLATSQAQSNSRGEISTAGLFACASIVPSWADETAATAPSGVFDYCCCTN